MRFAKIIGCGAGAALLLGLAACGGSDTAATPAVKAPAVLKATFAAGTTMARLQKQGSITIGIKYDQPLFGLKGLGDTPEGFDVEIAKSLAAGLGIAADKITWVETPSKVREEALEQKRVDLVVATYTINDQRKERVTFAGPYYVAGQDLMVEENNTTITGPQSLRAAKAKVCSGIGTAPAEKILKYIDPDQLVLFDVYSKCADALRTGTVDAVTTDNAILLGLASQSAGKFRVLGKAFTEEPWGIGVPKGDVPFCEFVDATLTRAAADGSYARAWDATIGTATSQDAVLPKLDPCV